ncbi:hypothetical protein ZIOFF_070554 [Zingiber officinale]|uniref:Uncharacterized protein n=1 Tax=Zingiber officinale TaxID=94328 RepID=A0A8J5CAK0_ZINOF|nr:hypothetical protein ZIOFF_070554 [Zingiber officinale]
MTTPNNLPNGGHHQRPHPPPDPRRQRHYLGTPIATPSSSSSAAYFKGCCCYLGGARCDVPQRAARCGGVAGLRAARAQQPPRPDPRKIEYSLCIIELQENKRAVRGDKCLKYSQEKQKREKKKWGFRKSNHDDNGSFIQMHRQQNIIERILEDVQNEQHHQHRVHKRLVVWMSMSGTIEGSSLNPNALHSVLQQLQESVQSLLEHFHQWRQQEMAGKDLFETASVEALVMNLSTKSPKKGVRLGKYREKPVQCVRPKCTPHRIILRGRLTILCFFCFKF